MTLIHLLNIILFIFIFEPKISNGRHLLNFYLSECCKSLNNSQLYILYIKALELLDFYHIRGFQSQQSWNPNDAFFFRRPVVWSTISFRSLLLLLDLLPLFWRRLSTILVPIILIIVATFLLAYLGITKDWLFKMHFRITITLSLFKYY